MTYLKRTHLSTLSIASALLLSACGGGGGSSGGTTTPTPVADTTSPFVSFSPSTLSVQSELTAASNLTATDGSGIASGPTVTCTNGGSFDVGPDIFTAAAVTTNTTSVCTAVASDAAGNQGSATLTVTMTPPPPPDTTAPVITFNPPTLSVASGSTATAVLTVTDEGGVSATPTASCTNGGTFDVTTGVFTPPDVTSQTTVVCTITVTDDGGNVGTGTLSVTVTPAPVAAAVTLSGTLTYDRVPVNQDLIQGVFFSGLNFNGIVQMPIRQAPVDLLSASGAVLDTTVSDDNGDYSFTVDSGENVRVRVRSEIQKGAPNEVDLQVVDNTSGDAVYALQGPLSVVPASNQTRDLNADSGWGGFSYTGTRAAAPFALLDTIFETLEDFIAVDPDVDFPPFDVQWSTLNVPQGGNVDLGQISTSSFTLENRGGIQVPVIRILGDENNDTDEFDIHVVVHEFGHYFENQLSRADSVGGPHSAADLLDSRVAFGEGWGNALSGIILEDPIYRDSFGNQQSQGFIIDVEENANPSVGWYSEGSVQSILYDLFDTVDDGADTTSIGLGPIYEAFVDPDYAETEAFTTIYAFLKALDNQPGVNAADVEALTDAQLIFGSGEFGIGETNNGGLPGSAAMPGALPVYLNLPTNGTPVPFCSFDNFGDFNRHGNRRFFRIEVPAAGAYQFSMQQTTTGPGDPDFFVFREGTLVAVGGSAASRSEVQTINLPAGTHVMDAHAFDNVGSDAQIAQGGLTRRDICYNFTVEAQ